MKPDQTLHYPEGAILVDGSDVYAVTQEEAKITGATLLHRYGADCPRRPQVSHPLYGQCCARIYMYGMPNTAQYKYLLGHVMVGRARAGCLGMHLLRKLRVRPDINDLEVRRAAGRGGGAQHPDF